MRYQPVIGLEIHAELLTDSKVFCTCQNEFGGSENTRVCPRCSGLPGTLPLLNQGAVRLAAKAGFALDCTVNNYSAFDRKNYFYPDLPKAYQITQFDHPICTGRLYNRHRRIRTSELTTFTLRRTRVSLCMTIMRAFQWLTITVAVYRLLKS